MAYPAPRLLAHGGPRGGSHPRPWPALRGCASAPCSWQAARLQLPPAHGLPRALAPRCSPPAAGPARRRPCPQVHGQTIVVAPRPRPARPGAAYPPPALRPMPALEAALRAGWSPAWIAALKLPAIELRQQSPLAELHLPGPSSLPSRRWTTASRRS